MPEFSLRQFDSNTFVVKDENAEWAICSAFEGQSESPERRAEVICRLLNNHYRGVALDAIYGRAPQEWACEMACRIADEAGYDEDLRAGSSRGYSPGRRILTSSLAPGSSKTATSRISSNI